MPNTRLIKRRIRSVQSIGKVTKAMEMVAASRMKRAQDRALAARPYDEGIRQVIANLSAAIPPGQEAAVHPLLDVHPVQRVELLLITTDRGLCGALNSNIIRVASNFILEQEAPVSVVAVGRKGRDFCNRYGQDLLAEFTGIGDKPGLLDIAPIAKVVTEDYASGKADRVYLIYPQFVSTVTQNPVVHQLLPVEPTEFPAGQNVEYIFEPDPSYVLGQLLPRFVEMQV
ncbi:MAG: ATP synthase F1 subunit gamma, partial [Dehalococcoidia bacterium]|nr:ATP synthase F1 subunit gamma [Dehalococcoidia bacterium]